MRSNTFREAKTSLYLFALILFVCIVFYLIASMFTSMGYEGFHKEKSNETFTENNRTIIIDPGHGGEDPGASANGLTEKDLNLEISLILSDYLRTFGYDTVLTRDTDILLGNKVSGSMKQQDLKNRVDIANSYPSGYFVSIHMNKFSAEYCKGLQTFYSNNCEESSILAETVQNNACILQQDNKRVIKDGTDNIYVLENILIPAILIECGFLSNYEEAKMLSTDEYKTALAFSIYCGISTYLEFENES